MTSRLATWWRDQPLRSRLAAVVALPLTIAIGVAVTVAYVEVRHELRGQLDTQLRHQAAQLQRQAAFFTGQGFPVIQLHVEFGQTGGYVQAVAADGSTNTPPGQQAIALPVSTKDRTIAATQDGTSLRDARVGGVAVRILTAPLTEVYAVQVALPLTAVNGQLHRLAVAFVLLAVGAVVIAIGLVWLLTRRALAPVARLTDAAENIAATKDLTHRIEEPSGDELGRLAVSFNTMLDALDRSLAAQRQLVADASHELRTPLATLRTNAEVLRDFSQLAPRQREEVIAGIVGQVEELTGLVADVVELARGDEPVREPSAVDFDDLVNDAAAQARRHWPHITFDVATAQVSVLGVPQRLARAVANLLDNAAKFSPVGGQVDVRLNNDGTLRVRDHGPGVPAEALPHVFERFFRADDARGLPGSGLGLAIVKQVATSHGGQVTLHNAPDGGTVAELVIPPRTSPVPAPSPGTQAATAAQIDAS